MFNAGSSTRLGLQNQDWEKVVPMKALKSKVVLFLHNFLQPSSDTGQVIGSFVEVSIVQIVFFLEY